MGLQERLHAYITPTPELALTEARQAEAALLRGETASPLLGIPVAYKDIVMTKGIRTTCGSALHLDWVPDRDAAVVEQWRAAGTVMLGKRAVTADTDLRLTRYFGLSEGFFLRLQADHDLMARRPEIAEELRTIVPRAA